MPTAEYRYHSLINQAMNRYFALAQGDLPTAKRLVPSRELLAVQNLYYNRPTAKWDL